MSPFIELTESSEESFLLAEPTISTEKSLLSNLTTPAHTRPVRESLREINNDSWLLGDDIIISRTCVPGSDFVWSDNQGSFYNLSRAPRPLPPSRPVPVTSHVEKVYDLGDASAVWRIGDHFCKVKIPRPDATREHVTLAYLHQRRPLSFAIPEVRYHADYNGRYYLILSRVTGQTLMTAWPRMTETTKQHYVSRIVDICKELAGWQSDSITGVNGQYLPEYYLSPKTDDFRPQSLLTNCKEIGMVGSVFHFYHCDLGPENIIVNVDFADNNPIGIGIIDWETAGFVPKEWIQTKFRVSPAMDLEADDFDAKVDWRKRVLIELWRNGFQVVGEDFMVWIGKQCER